MKFTKLLNYKAYLLVVLLILLSGCKEKEKPQPEYAPEDQAMVAPKIKLPQLPESTEEDIGQFEDLIAVDSFQEPDPMEREYNIKWLRSARNRRQQERILNLRRVRRPVDPPKSKWHMYDRDYQEHGEHPVDLSTYPTDLSRMVLETQRITGVLEDEVNSQIQGRTVVIVDQAVPSADFSHVLIPAGSKMICQYYSLEKIGDSRLNFFCTRLIRPDGVSVFFQATNEASGGDGSQAQPGLKGADQKGRAGLIGEVDNRMFQRYGSAFLVSGISGLSQIGYNKDQTNQPSSNFSQFSHQFGNNLAQITAKLLDESIDLTPSINIKGGSVIQLRPAADLYFRKPTKIEGDKEQIKEVVAVKENSK